MNKHGLYSKAAQIVRSLPQERGTAEQMVAAAKRVGLKDAELQNAGPLPEGKVTREELAKHFEDKLPNMYVSQYGENPRFLTRDDGKRFMELQMRNFGDGLSPEEKREFDHLRQRNNASPHIMGEDNEDGEDIDEPLYSEYSLPGGKNYRERLLTLGTEKDKPKYNSSHWAEHDNVLAHIRMQDRMVGEDRESIRPIMERLAKMAGTGIRDLGSGAVHVGLQNGVITPEEAASVSRLMGWYTGHENKPGIGKRLLHVEELQSDWGQGGRDQGFNDGSAMKAYRDHVEDMRSRMRQSLLDQGLPEDVARPLYEKAEPWHLAKFHGEEEKLNSLRDAVNDQQGKVPSGPYVTNTQHWTDLALKNVLREAALGNYDGIVFTPGKAQADRYKLANFVDAIHYEPETMSLYGEREGRRVIEKDNVKPDALASHVGKDAAKTLLNPENHYLHDNTVRSSLTGNDLKMGGQGMEGYYDGIVPKSVMALAKQHDPDVKPGEPVQMGDYQGFHLPMTDKLKSSILDKGFPAMRRGGRVGYSTGGNVGGMMMRMRRAGINTRDDFWNRWRDYMRAKAGPDTRLSMTLSPDSHFKRIDDMLGSHRQTADERGLSQVLKNYGPPNEQGHMAARFPREILQGAGIEPTAENAHAVYEALPSDESGRVGFSNGGLADDNDSGISHILNGEEHVKANAPAARVGTASRPQAGEFSVGRGVRGGSGLLQAPDEPPLEGLPAEISIPMTGQVIQAGPDPRVRKVARDYMASTGMRYNPPTKYAKVDPSRSKRISDAYESMKDDASDPLTKASYDAMIKETMAQYHAAKAAGFKAEFWNPETDEDPYHASPRLATEDIRNNHHMWVYPTDAGYGSDGPITEEQIRKNPMLRPSGETWNGVPVTVNDIFRAVHDYFGHAKEGVGFRGNGEENAWRSHAAMFSPLARLAMTAETRGQNSWLNYGPFGDKNRKARTEESTFAPQKIGILPHWVHHEGAEDFILPEDIAEMQRVRDKHSRNVSRAMALTRPFTKKG